MWLLKIIIKIIISRLPIPYRFWKKVNIFKHGKMENFEYSRRIFEGHFHDMRKINEIENPIIMEIGPGDSLFSMVYSRKYTKKEFYFLDVKEYATKNHEIYYKLHKELEKEKFFNKKLGRSFEKFSDVLYFYNANYLTNGLKSIGKIKDNSIDYIFSHSVMEHVRKKDLIKLVKEMFRILKPNGVISHNINYKDHLDEGLNNLRFSEKLWESNLFANSGFYTNRIPAIEMHMIFKLNGFSLEKEYFGKWKKLPTKRRLLNNDFKKYTDKDLSVPTSSFLGKKPS
tara:strand:+ start:7653 stop:8504 length:852 start_codon:yes stop_codon:yes gene_type:complete